MAKQVSVVETGVLWGGMSASLSWGGFGFLGFRYARVSASFKFGRCFTVKKAPSPEASSISGNWGG